MKAFLLTSLALSSGLKRAMIAATFNSFLSPLFKSWLISSLSYLNIHHYGIMAPMHVTGRFSSAWKGAGSDFKGSLRVSSSPIADTGPLLSSHGNNLYNTNICKVGGGGVGHAKKQTFASWLSVFVRACRQWISTSCQRYCKEWKKPIPRM